MSIYAKDTSVSVEKSRSEIESILSKYGANEFMYATKEDKAMIQFKAEDRRIMFILNLPDRNSREFTNRTWGGKVRDEKMHPDDAYQKWEQACRQKWRALALSIKARLVSVADGIDTFEEAFMSRIVMPDGKTISDHMTPLIDRAYTTGKFTPMMLEFK